MRPLRRDGVFDCPIAGQPVKRGVKRNISLDESQHRRIRTECEPGREGVLCRPPLRRVDRSFGNSLGSEPSRQGVERRADLVKLANANGVDHGDGQPPPTVFLDELLLLEHPQSVADRLARYAEPSTELLLSEALARSERAVGNRFDQPLIGAVDQRRLRIERLQAIPPKWNSEFDLRSV